MEANRPTTITAAELATEYYRQLINDGKLIATIASFPDRGIVKDISVTGISVRMSSDNFMHAYAPGVMFDLEWIPDTQQPVSEDTAAKELLKAYANGQRNFSCAYLSCAYLSRVDLHRTNLSGSDLSGADLIGANLIGSDLSGANLIGADLIGSDLSGANLINTCALYTAFAPHMSSRCDSLTGELELTDGKITLLLRAGCWSGTPDEFRQRIADEKPNNGAQYLAAATYIEACFNDDMMNRKWDYLLTWDEDHK